MFYLDTQTNTRYYLGRAFSYGGKNYLPSGATHDVFMALGFSQVVIQPRPSDKFYIVSGPDNTGAYSATPRDLDELKTQYKLQTKQSAFQRISGTDWYVIRLLELGASDAPVPAAISSYREAVRTASDARCAEIDACASVAALQTLLEAPAELYDEDTDTFSVNPDALTQFPEQPETGVYY